MSWSKNNMESEKTMHKHKKAMILLRLKKPMVNAFKLSKPAKPPAISTVANNISGKFSIRDCRKI
ncbi:hypothetical protein [Flavobacterium silvaticum]|uniref:Uncharacterized protein n=1 Tax=Flavobacterium silvaticum TaxID=1852020 RepID=A0A972FP34_9FLAO|nr:hypothetical protein [Flavobacterium silvaticum]NMH29634.1 hypothetical protein [Flavobacterium silvaticum]